MPPPSLFVRHSYPCCERLETPSLYRPLKDRLSFAVVCGSANRTACSVCLLNPERTGVHAIDRAHSLTGCRAMASRTEYKARDYQAHQTGCGKAFHKRQRLSRMFGYNHEQESSRGFVSRCPPGRTSEICPTSRQATFESWRP